MSTTLQKKKPPTVREGEPRAPVALQLGDVLDLSDDALLRLAALNDTLHLERDAEGRLVIMPPPGHASSRRNSEIVAELIFWNRAQGEPGVVSGPDGGFRLPSGAVRAPDAACVAGPRALRRMLRGRTGALPAALPRLPRRTALAHRPRG